MRVATVIALATLAACSGAPSSDPSEFVFTGRTRMGGVVSESTLRWEAKKTAVIICDMWDSHTCKSAARRVGEMVPKLNAFVRAARAKGAVIIHCPSDVIEFYKDYPQRKMILAQPNVAPPMDIIRRPFDSNCEGRFPIDLTTWGCDDVPQCPDVRPYPWTRQHKDIEIAPEDAISAEGREIWNLCQARGITNIIMTGVHANFCIVNRSFGIRQMRMLGRQVVLVRDLTDALYNPKDAPFVSHERGTELVVEHIERYWCPSILSSDVTRR